MPLSSLDIVAYYTNGATQATNTLSIGGSISATTIADNTSGNVFDDVTGDEATSGDTEYRCIAIKDTNATYDMINAKFYINGYSRAGSGYDTISFALQKPNGTTVQLLATEAATPDANQFTVATGATVAWTTEGAPSSTLSYGTMTAGSWVGVWFRRVVPASATAYTNRSCTLQISCETTASPILGNISKSFAIDWTKNSFTLRNV
jgi:hypothetical protein